MRFMIVLMLVGAAAAAATTRRLAADATDGGAAKLSAFWGVAGEKWEPDGPFMDFSYAGACVGGECCLLVEAGAGQPTALLLLLAAPSACAPPRPCPAGRQATAAVMPPCRARPSPSAWRILRRVARATAPQYRQWSTGPTAGLLATVRGSRAAAA